MEARPEPVTDAATPTRVVQIAERDRPAAAQRLVEASAPDDPGAGRRFLAAARLHGLDIRRLWASVDVRSARGRPREVCLLVPGSGRTAMLFTSTPGDPAAIRELGDVIDHACGAAGDAALAQALLAPEETAVAEALRHAGFEELADLAYLRRARPTAGEFVPGALPAEIDLLSVATLDAPAERIDGWLMAAMRRSYTATLDCPRLCELRRTEDVLESHRATGEHDPSLWWLVRHAGEPAGVMLFSPSVAQSTLELVYLGVDPALRGRGLARRILEHGLATLAGRQEASVTCAVDLRNMPARRLYERLGFADVSRRRAFVRALGAMSVDNRAKDS